jgi:hypothetical protein
MKKKSNRVYYSRYKLSAPKSTWHSGTYRVENIRAKRGVCQLTEADNGNPYSRVIKFRDIAIFSD